MKSARALLALQQSPLKEAAFLPGGRKSLQDCSGGLWRHRAGELETLGLAAWRREQGCSHCRRKYKRISASLKPFPSGQPLPATL